MLNFTSNVENNKGRQVRPKGSFQKSRNNTLVDASSKRDYILYAAVISQDAREVVKRPCEAAS